MVRRQSCRLHPKPFAPTFRQSDGVHRCSGQPNSSPLYVSVEKQQKNANGEDDYFVVHPIIPLIHQLEKATAEGADPLLGLLQKVPNAKGVEEIKQVLHVIHSIITAGKENISQQLSIIKSVPLKMNFMTHRVMKLFMKY